MIVKKIVLIVITLSFTQRHLQAQHVKVLDSSLSEDLHTLTFFGDHGWAVSYGTGKVFHSIDQGKTWQLQWQTDSVYLEEIQFIDKRNGWLTGADGNVLRTVDGGLSWKYAGPTSLEDLPITYYGSRFFPAGAGWVSGMKRDKSTSKFYNAYLYNGQWLVDSVALGQLLLKINTDNKGNVYASSSNGVYRLRADKNEYLPVYKVDGKLTGPLRDVGAIDEFIYAIGANGYFISSTDTGNTWTTIKVSDKRLRSCLFTSSMDGFIAGDAGTLLTTKDGGKTWSAIEKANTDLHRIVKANTGAWICGKKGTLIKIELR